MSDPLPPWCSWLSRGSHIVEYDWIYSRYPKVCSSILHGGIVFDGCISSFFFGYYKDETKYWCSEWEMGNWRWVLAWTVISLFYESFIKKSSGRYSFIKRRRSPTNSYHITRPPAPSSLQHQM